LRGGVKNGTFAVTMRIEDARIARHEEYAAGYRLLVLDAPTIAAAVKPGQFVHVKVPNLDGAVLRRPFSVFNADGTSLSVLYKPVGRGTEAMTRLAPGEAISVVGPLGNGFPAPEPDTYPVLVAGGYGVAPLYMLATRTGLKGTVFIGAASAADVLCADDFRQLDWEVLVSTVDGTLGTRGLVTDVLDEWLGGRRAAAGPEFFACGPDGMLRAVGERAIRRGDKAWLSLDKHMGCGVGACLACVQKVRRGKDVEWVRVCKEGPVFEAREIVWES
jgi:dihydroorotate dehydrogenase electron transfer subunit